MAGPDSGAEEAFLAALDGVLQDLALRVDEAARGKMLAHYRLLVQWNRRMNLTTLRDPVEVAVRHFGESLFLAREVKLTTGSVLDVGSGAGFPGLPVAAVAPGVSVTLLEAVQRKAVFLREVSRSWSNVEVRNARLEEVSGRWDCGVMRGVAMDQTLPNLVGLCSEMAILTTIEGLEEARRAGLFEWKAPLPVPWGERRVLLLGRSMGGG